MYFIAFFYDVKRKLGKRIGLYDYEENGTLFVENVFDEDRVPSGRGEVRINIGSEDEA